MSMSYLKPGIAPKQLYWFEKGNRRIEIWRTTCIVTNFRITNCGALLNPSNPQLSGVKNFPYFPRGGPIPTTMTTMTTMHRDWQPLGHVSSWGGMEVGSGMMFPVSVVDGLVHRLGGWKLEAECRFRQMVAVAKRGRWGSQQQQQQQHEQQQQNACPYGEAVVTSSGSGELRESYDAIIHTATPFYKFHNHDSSPEECLFNCYRNALRVGLDQDHQRIATPLMGAGCKGFPELTAMEIAADATTEWCSHEQGRAGAVVFGLMEEAHCHELAALVEKRF